MAKSKIAENLWEAIESSLRTSYDGRKYASRPEGMFADLPPEAVEQGYGRQLFRHVGPKGLNEYDLAAQKAHAGTSPLGVYTSPTDKLGASDTRLYLKSMADAGKDAEAIPLVSRAKDMFVIGVDKPTPEMRNLFIKKMEERTGKKYSDPYEKTYFDEKIKDFMRSGDPSASPLTREQQRELFMELGYDGLVRNRDEFVFFKPEQLRRPDAEFNPEKRDVADWKAAIAPVATTGLLAAGVPTEEAEAAFPLPGKFVRRVADEAFDPRYDERAKEQERLRNLTTEVESRGTQNPQEVSIFDFEGRPFITSMSDRTAAGGLLTKINDVELNTPVNLQGGQGYMFENPGQVWASGVTPVGHIMKEAARVKAQTGQDPIYLPWRMAPTGGDFASMTGESMLAYSSANMTKKNKQSLNKKIKELIPDWKGVDNPESLSQYASARKETRDKVLQILDRDFRNEGGLNKGEARLAVSDQNQTAAPEGGLMNVGQIFTDKPIIEQSGHPSYPLGVPGEGIGRLKEDLMVHQMLPSVVAERRIADPRSPSAPDIRSLQMVPYGGIVTDKLLRSLEKDAAERTRQKAAGLLAAPAAATAGLSEASVMNPSNIPEDSFFSMRNAANRMADHADTFWKTLSKGGKQAEFKAPRNPALQDVAMAYNKGSRNSLFGGGESSANVAMSLAYGEQPRLMDVIFGALEQDPDTLSGLLSAATKGR